LRIPIDEIHRATRGPGTNRDADLLANLALVLIKAGDREGEQLNEATMV
jgi:hypothetical protein